jgi:DNA primase
MRVEDILETENIYYLSKGSDFLVRCLNEEHQDKNPSMRIDQITGIFNCFSCGYKGNLFTLYGEAPNQLQLIRERFKQLISKKRSESVGIHYPKDSTPYKGDWRNIKPETYEYFKAFQAPSNEFVGRIVFPIFNILGNISAFTGRHTTGGIPKYYIFPRKAALPLYPSGSNNYKGSVILVEGIFDVINLYDKGLTNAICCFGVNNVNEDKLSLLKLQGIDFIYVFLDGDEAGQKGAKKIKSLCEKIGLPTKNIYIENTDPGALNETQVHKLKQTLYGV